MMLLVTLVEAFDVLFLERLSIVGADQAILDKEPRLTSGPLLQDDFLAYIL